MLNNYKSRTLFVASVSLVVGASAHGQSFYSVMSGENSTYFSFLNGTATRTTVTSIQSPFVYPGTGTGAYDGTYTYPSGNGSATPPWWFAYTTVSPYTATDYTNAAIGRNPSYGQISSSKSGVYGILTKATFQGSGTSSGGFFIEAIFFGERVEWAGQREFGFFRPVDVADTVYFYWSTNSNCSNYDNQGYPWCRTSIAPNATETPSSPPLVAEHFVSEPITGVTTSTEYTWIAYVFWASWDSTYKFRVEQWNSAYTGSVITAFNVDTIDACVNLGLTTSGTSGYVTLAAQRKDPFSAGGAQLGVSLVKVAQSEDNCILVEGFVRDRLAVGDCGLRRDGRIPA